MHRSSSNLRGDEKLEHYGTCTLEHDTLESGSCRTCADSAVPVRVLHVTGMNATVQDRTGTRAEVAIDLVDNVQVEDMLLVHSGVALHKIPTHSDT